MDQDNKEENSELSSNDDGINYGRFTADEIEKKWKHIVKQKRRPWLSEPKIVCKDPRMMSNTKGIRFEDEKE